MRRATIQICTKDRHSEVALLLQSLRTQTFKDWDIVILDDGSGIPLQQSDFFMKIWNRIKLENHRTRFIRRDLSQGVVRARNKVIDSDTFKNPYILRCDDDCILEPDYIEKLFKVIDAGYDIATGIVPNIETPQVKREIKHVKPVISKIEIKKGEIIHTGDDLGFGYVEEEILPTHHFRTNALYKSNIKIKYYERLTKVGFREESIWSLEAQNQGYKLGCHTGAIAFHLRTFSGGCRYPDYAECVQIDEQTFKEWVKKNVKA